MLRPALAALAIAIVLYVPVPLGAHPSGGTNALVPVEEIQPKVQVPAGTGVAEAPSAAPAPIPEDAPELVPTDQVESDPAPRAGAVEAPPPAPEPTAVPALRPSAELAQDTTIPEPPPEETPNQETPSDEKDPEEFEEEFDDVPPEGDQGGGTPQIAPRQRAVPAADHLPQTGRELLVLGLIGSGLMLIGMGFRGISQPRLQRI